MSFRTSAREEAAEAAVEDLVAIIAAFREAGIGAPSERSILAAAIIYAARRAS